MLTRSRNTALDKLHSLKTMTVDIDESQDRQTSDKSIKCLSGTKFYFICWISVPSLSRLIWSALLHPKLLPLLISECSLPQYKRDFIICDFMYSIVKKKVLRKS
uniref:Uncharacterized protein n=1 Tax=Pyxicephalus adspersus TaxID=30357 RepID=A0AAV3AZD4_PYXAD|nr:TPA: hypothetical protein GDO54_008092 [Pyxicephalus adspersus]